MIRLRDPFILMTPREKAQSFYKAFRFICFSIIVSA